MTLTETILQNIDANLSYRTSRSSGPGGQNVNKLETRVEVLLNIYDHEIFDDRQQKALKKALRNKIDKAGNIHFSSQKFKSQAKNKTEVKNKLLNAIEYALRPKKNRIKTKPSKKAKEKRLKLKKQRSEIKSKRGRLKF